MSHDDYGVSIAVASGILLLAFALVISGGKRISPEQQAEDYATCTKAGMRAYKDQTNQIRCET